MRHKVYHFPETVTASGTWPKGHSLGQNSGHCERREAICLLGARGLFLGAFFSEAVSCLREDRFGKRRLAMTSGFLLKKWLKAKWCRPVGFSALTIKSQVFLLAGGNEPFSLLI
jgi:hypothetical protein